MVPASEFALAAEPAANVGAVEGAEKPPSDDIAREKKGEPNHQITSRATADNLEKRCTDGTRWDPTALGPNLLDR